MEKYFHIGNNELGLSLNARCQFFGSFQSYASDISLHLLKEVEIECSCFAELFFQCIRILPAYDLSFFIMSKKIISSRSFEIDSKLFCYLMYNYF